MPEVFDQALTELMELGIAYLHTGLPEDVQHQIKRLYAKGQIKVIVAAFETVWALSSLTADLVII